ncbi:MAG: translocation/assembly module TamB domain-containing protein, partial [candidate division WOR-3 bacterium]
GLHQVLKKITKGLVVLLVIVVVIISIILYFFLKIPEILSELVKKELNKPFIYKKLEFNLKNVKLYNFEIPGILKGDSLKISFSISELIKNRSIYNISLYNINLDFDSLNNSIVRENGTKQGDSKFLKFKINRFYIYSLNLSIGNLNIRFGSLISSITSNGKFLEIHTKGYNIQEIKTINQRLDSLSAFIRVYHDSVFLSSSVYSDSLKFNDLNLKIFPNQRIINFKTKYARFKQVNIYNAFGDIKTDSLEIFSSGDSLTFEQNKILKFRTKLKLKNDSIFIKYADFYMLNGYISFSGFLFDTGFNIRAIVKGLNPAEKTFISGNFDIKGNFNSNLSVKLDNLSVKFDTINLQNIEGYVYSPDFKNFLFKNLTIKNRIVEGFFVGKYNIERSIGSFDATLNYVKIENFNNLIKGLASFRGSIEIYKNSFELKGFGKLTYLTYEDYKVDSGIYNLHLKDSVINFNCNFSSLKMKDNTIIDSSKLIYNQVGKNAQFSIIAYSNHGNLISDGYLFLLDTLRSKFTLTFINFDTIINFRNGFFENYKNHTYIKLRNENIIFEFLLDSLDIDLNFISLNFDYNKVLKIFNIDSISFNGEITLRITNRIDDPKLFLNTSLYDVQIKKFKIDEIDLMLYYYDRQINIDKFKLVNKNGTFEGNIIFSSLFKLNPFSLTLEDGQINGEIAFNGFPVDIIEPLLFPNIVIDDGYIEGKARISGSFVSPILSGNMKIYSKDISFTPLEIEFKKSEGILSFYKNVIRIDNIVFESSKFGSAKLNGFILISNKFEDFNLDLTLILNKLYFSMDEYTEFFVSGNLNISGKFPNVYIEGTLNIDEGYVNYPIGYKSNSQQQEVSNPIKYYITINANRRIFFSNEFIDAELSAKLILQKTKDIGQYLEGSFQIIRGNVYLYTLNQNFRITEGKINVVRNNISFDIIAEAEIYNDTIIAHVMGTLENPYFELTSRKGRSQFEILNLVLSGEISEKGINLAQQIFTKNIKRRFNINELTLGTIGNSALITLGSYITEKLYLRLTTDIQNPDIYNLKVQYFINPDFSVFGERKENNYTIGIGYRLRF